MKTAPLILSFAKPGKVMSSDDYASIAADGAPPGTYTGNMSEADKRKWKAKLVGQRSGNHQIEIRTTEPRANLVVVVNGTMPSQSDVLRCRMGQVPLAVKMSANGPTYFPPELWRTLETAIAEARTILNYLDNPIGESKKIALKAAREGRNPIEALNAEVS